MSKKHFEYAAQLVREQIGCVTSLELALIENAYVALFLRFGPRFDERRFRDACKVVK